MVWVRDGDGDDCGDCNFPELDSLKPSTMHAKWKRDERVGRVSLDLFRLAWRQ